MEMECLLKCGVCCTQSDQIGAIKWNNLKENSRKWVGLDTYGDVYTHTNWDSDREKSFCHKLCRVKIADSKRLELAKKRYNKAHISVRDSPPLESPSPSKRLRSSIEGPLHNASVCVWCRKGDDNKHSTGKFKSVRKPFHRIGNIEAWNRFKRHIGTIQDDDDLKERLAKVIASTNDPFAANIGYHKKCWDKYISNSNFTDSDKIHLQNVSLLDARSLFFRHVDDVIFNQNEIRTLQSLLLDYKSIVSNHGYDVGDIKSSYLKDLLLHEYKEAIGFHERHAKYLSEWVYDTRNGGGYIQCAFQSLGISDEQLLKNVASRIHTDIHQSASELINWPPSIAELEKSESSNKLLLRLINLLKFPKRKENIDSPKEHAITSILTSYITSRRTSFTTNLSVMIHGLTKSKEVVDILHKEGLGISYEDVLMLRDVWALNDLTHSVDCPYELADGFPAIAIVDNDDFKMDTLTGNGSKAHRTNVMYVQPERYMSYIGLPPSNISQLNPSGELKRIALEMQGVEPYKTTFKAEPPVRQNVINNETHNEMKQRTRSVVHVLARANEELERPEPDNQKVPGLSGFFAKMSDPIEKSIALYHMTYPEPPSKTILHDVMTKVARSVEQKNMPFAFVVGDYPVYKLILDLKSENPSTFSKLIPFIGPFHVQMSFIYTIYKRFKGSGISDILVAAGVIAAGSVDQALRGKHFNRGVRCLRLFYETLVYIALTRRLKGSSLSEQIKSSLQKLRNSEDTQELRASYSELVQSDDIKKIVETLFVEQQESDQANFFISFMEMVEILNQNIHACRTCNWNEFKFTLKQMLPWLTVYGNYNYGRHLPDFVAVLDNLTYEQELFMGSGMFAQSISGNPYSGIALDMWIETTMNKGSKLKAGWLAILTNEKQLLTNTRNINNINRVRNAVHRHAGYKIQKETKHADCFRPRCTADEKGIQDMITCLNEFQCDPFDISDSTLRSLQSGLTATDELLADVVSAKTDGEKMVKDFMNERVFAKSKSLHDRITRSNRLNFDNQKIKHPVGGTAKGKAKEMETEALSSIVELVGQSGALNLEDILQYRVTQECLPLFNANGTMRKTQKSKLMQTMNFSASPVPSMYTAIIDMGLIWRLASPTKEDREKQDATKFTWGDYSNKLIQMIIKRHKNAYKIICVNDNYSETNSIKDSERILRQSNKQTGNVFMKTEQAFPSPQEYNNLLTKTENKNRLQDYLKNQLQKIANVTETSIVYVVVGKSAYNLSTHEVEDLLMCRHAEADTAMFTIYNAIRESGNVDPVVIDTEDTDNFIQAAYVANKVPGTLLLKQKNRLVDAKSLCEENMIDCIIPLHVLTGCDTNSGFYGIGKTTVATRVRKSPEARQLLSACGESLQLSDDAVQCLTKFVIKYVYSDSKSETVSEARASRWKKQKKKSLLRMPPDMDSLSLHFKRANYLSYIQKNFVLNNHPSPLDSGWHIEKCMCLPTRCTLPPLPSCVTYSRLGHHPGPGGDAGYDLSSNDDTDDECFRDIYLSSGEDGNSIHSDSDDFSDDSLTDDSDTN